jgi:amidase
MAAEPKPKSNYPLEEATIGDTHTAMKAGQVTARGLVEAYCARIAAYDQQGPTLNSVVTVNGAATERADELDASFASTGEFSGPLHGMPILVKDNVETKSMPTTQGTIILGKTTLPDFATSWWAYSSLSGETRNPYALDRDPGGSSAGIDS